MVARLAEDNGAEVHFMHPTVAETACRIKTEDIEVDIQEGTVEEVSCESCKGWLVYNGYMSASA